MYGIYIIAVTFAVEFISLSILSKERQLPFISKFPFNWKVSPTYEILFVFQVLTNICVNITSILGHDFLFIALLLNIICQFKLLKETLRKIGDENNIMMYNTILDWTKDVSFTDTNIDVKLLKKCIQHHTKLLKYVLYNLCYLLSF